MKRLFLIFLVVFVYKIEAINIFNASTLAIFCIIKGNKFETSFLLEPRGETDVRISLDEKEIEFEGIPILRRVFKSNLIKLGKEQNNFLTEEGESTKKSSIIVLNLLRVDQHLYLRSRPFREERVLWEKRFKAQIDQKDKGTWYTGKNNSEYVQKGNERFLIYEIKDRLKLVN